jgi:hypothetical protein
MDNDGGNHMDNKADRLRVQLTFGVAVIGICQSWLPSSCRFLHSGTPGSLVS